ncbi:MAG: RNA polymerase sigma factor [Phaeodactylibacter sp.]|nr:RNA polymerase sigma factor [Phaeodactylibacter sp.]MCB9272397.1 RNA polymerase sigma factor [Lewinellaceae bacterium]
MSQLEFTHAFARLEKLLLLFALQLTKDEEDAKDLLQETAYKAFKYRSLYQPHTNLKAWLMTIMRNTFINHYRQKKRRQVLYTRPGSDFLFDAGSRVVNNAGESDVAAKEITAVIAELEDWLKVPFLMHYQGYKYEEIAAGLGIPLGTVKSRIFFARKKLQESLKGLYMAQGQG